MVANGLVKSSGNAVKSLFILGNNTNTYYAGPSSGSGAATVSLSSTVTSTSEGYPSGMGVHPPEEYPTQTIPDMVDDSSDNLNLISNYYANTDGEVDKEEEV